MYVVRRSCCHFPLYSREIRHAMRCDLNKLMKGSWLMSTRTPRTPKAPKEIFEHNFQRRCELWTSQVCERSRLIESADFKLLQATFDERRKRGCHLSLGHFPIEFIHLKIWQTAENQSPLNYLDARKIARTVVVWNFDTAICSLNITQFTAFHTELCVGFRKQKMERKKP